MKSQRHRPIVGIPCGLYTFQDDIKAESSVMLQSYIEAVVGAGGAPMLIPIMDQADALYYAYERLDGLLLAGGAADVAPSTYDEAPHPECRPADAPRDQVELTLVPWALSDGMPVLAICRGIQVLNVAAGGSLWQDIPSQVPDCLQHVYRKGDSVERLSHTVSFEPGSRLANILDTQEIKVNSLHHQAVKDVGRGLRVTARAADGVIEGLEGESEGWIVGVQWHPEWLRKNVPRMKQLFATFSGECGAFRDEKGSL